MFDINALRAEVESTSIREVAEQCSVPVSAIAALVRGANVDEETSGKLAVEFPIRSVRPQLAESAQLECMVREEQSAAAKARYAQRKQRESWTGKRMQEIQAAIVSNAVEKKQNRLRAEEQLDAQLTRAKQHALVLERIEILQLMGITSAVILGVRARVNREQAKRYWDGLEPSGVARRRLHAFFEEMRECVRNGMTWEQYTEELRDACDLDEQDGVVSERVVNERNLDRKTVSRPKRHR